VSDRLCLMFHVDSVPFTPAIIAGEASLGGSESACLGLARALQARGHDVHVVTTHLADGVPAVDRWGVTWHKAEALHTILPLIDPDVFVALRAPQVFGMRIPARLRILWNQDMLVGEMAKLVTMSYAWAFDAVAYVSAYQRKQWEGVCEELTPLGWVTKNGYDPSLVPTDVEKVPGRVIHISRPERGLLPLLQMWPELKQRVPHAELQICRYQSMYDGEGSQVKAICEDFDRLVAQMQERVGGITYLGSLGKAELYRAIAEAEVMWYPGVVDFAETSCIAAIEAQANGTPLVCSYKGALPETAPSAVFIHGDAMSPEYQKQSIDAVARLLSDEPVFKRTAALMQAQGREHVKGYTYDVIAAEWEAFIWQTFDARATDTRRIVDQLLYEDDHVAAKALTDDPAIIAECERIERGEAQTSEMYAKYALDPTEELTIRRHPRMDYVVERFTGCTSILDLACGNGAFAIAMAQGDPARHVLGLDYAAANIEAARKAAEALQVSDRVSFARETVCDLATGTITPDAHALLHGQSFDGVFLGEFCEHVAGVTTLLAGVRSIVGTGVRVVITVPSGPFGDLRDPETPKGQKGHVHHFRPKDLQAIFGAQPDCEIDYLDCGDTNRGHRVGHWVIRFTTSDVPFGERPIAHWHRTIRPKAKLSVGIIAHDCTPDLARCLHDVFGVADEIIVADCASNDRQELERLCQRYDAKLLSLTHVALMHGGFSEARNATLTAATGDWFMWIDADEQLMGCGSLWQYLESGPFLGYALKQNHLMLDAAQHFDTPIRVFRRLPSIEFYGCVHEQPQMGDCNGDIVPSLQLNDVQLAHTGYMHEGIRRQKATRRNLPLLVQDRKVFPDRVLGVVLVIRDLVNQAIWREQKIGGCDAECTKLFGNAIALFEKHFASPAHKYHSIARPFYEAAVQRMHGALEIEWSFGGKVHGLNGSRPKPHRWWVRDYAHIWPLVEHETNRIKASKAPLVIDVEPISAQEAVAV
jgi:glycosyltransferase involved in cell wall biosynthesis/2-polyprenyl-3-methyl-5-hydroxy-6-metoxy-1,4-benzoquinol methylase